MIFNDQLGRDVELAQHPRRIISLVPSQTELLFDLSLEKEIAGITKFCVHPADKVKGVTKIGGTKNVNLPKIHSLQPDLIIANKEENEEEQVRELMKYYPVWISDIHTVTDALAMIKSVGEITNHEKEAALVGEEVGSLLRNYERNASSLSVAYLIWYRPYMTVGADTFINSMLSAAGFENVFAGAKRYPECSIEEIISHKPDYIFLSSEPFPFKEKHINEIKSIYPEQKVVVVDGEMFSWYGSRMRKAFAYFEELTERLK